MIVWILGGIVVLGGLVLVVAPIVVGCLVYSRWIRQEEEKQYDDERQVRHARIKRICTSPPGADRDDDRGV